MRGNVTHDYMMIVTSVILMALFIGSISISVITGKSLAQVGTDIISTILDDTAAGTVKGLAGTTEEMPAAAVYNLMQASDSKAIDYKQSSTKLIIDGKQVEFFTHLTGRVLVETNLTETGMYQVILHSTDCMIEKGYCSCGARALLGMPNNK